MLDALCGERLGVPKPVPATSQTLDLHVKLRQSAEFGTLRSQGCRLAHLVALLNKGTGQWHSISVSLHIEKRIIILLTRASKHAGLSRRRVGVLRALLMQLMTP